MFNSYYIGGNTNNQKCVVNMNTPSSGFIQKSNPMSRFIRFQRGSVIEGSLFPTDPRKTPCLIYKEQSYVENHKSWESNIIESEEREEVVVLQVCIFGDDYMLAEYVFKKDIDERVDK